MRLKWRDYGLCRSIEREERLEVKSANGDRRAGGRSADDDRRETGVQEYGQLNLGCLNR